MASSRVPRFRRLAVFTAAVTAIPFASLLAPSAVFAAAPPYPTATCNANNYGAIKYTTSIGTAGFLRATPDTRMSVAPGQSTGTTTVTAEVTLNGSAKVSVGASVNGSLVFASAEAQTTLELQVGVAFRAGQSWTSSSYRNTKTYYRTAVAYFGATHYTGNYTKFKCGLSPNTGFHTWLTETTNTYGYWITWNSGMAWCEDDAAVRAAYGQYSIDYDAVSKC
jgi:hypothetical protein